MFQLWKGAKGHSPVECIQVAYREPQESAGLMLALLLMQSRKERHPMVPGDTDKTLAMPNSAPFSLPNLQGLC